MLDINEKRQIFISCYRYLPDKEMALLFNKLCEELGDDFKNKHKIYDNSNKTVENIILILNEILNDKNTLNFFKKTLTSNYDKYLIRAKEVLELLKMDIDSYNNYELKTGVTNFENINKLIYNYKRNGEFLYLM